MNKTTYKQFLAAFKDRFNTRLKAMGQTVAQAAEAMQMSEAQLQALLTGKNKMNLEHVFNFANFFGIPAENLFTELIVRTR